MRNDAMTPENRLGAKPKFQAEPAAEGVEFQFHGAQTG